MHHKDFDRQDKKRSGKSKAETLRRKQVRAIKRPVPVTVTEEA